MAKIINIPDEYIAIAVQGLGRYFNYQDVLGDGTDNPESKAVFAKRKLAQDTRSRIIKGLIMLRNEAADPVPDVVVEPE